MPSCSHFIVKTFPNYPFFSPESISTGCGGRFSCRSWSFPPTRLAASRAPPGPPPPRDPPPPAAASRTSRCRASVPAPHAAAACPHAQTPWRARTPRAVGGRRAADWRFPAHQSKDPVLLNFHAHW